MYPCSPDLGKINSNSTVISVNHQISCLEIKQKSYKARDEY